MRLKLAVPLLLLSTSAAWADINDNFKTTSATLHGWSSDPDGWIVHVKFVKMHVVVFDNGDLPKGELLDVYVSLTRNDLSDYWVGEAIVPLSAATFGANLGSATLTTTLQLDHWGSASMGTKTIAVSNLRLDGVGDIGTTRTQCDNKVVTAVSHTKTMTASAGSTRSALMTSASITDGTTDYLANFAASPEQTFLDTSDVRWVVGVTR